MYYIEINSGDEYRAKIENGKIKIEKEKKKEEEKEENLEDKNIKIPKMFFKDIYDKAMEITKEIIKEMEKYSKKSGKKGIYKTTYQGMGNNVIAFCAERGQGKTSAMQSFSNMLKKDNKKKYEEKEYKEVYFEVLDSIDPSSLDNGESIIRVLISRIFDNLIARLENIVRYDYDEYDLQKKKKDIFTLFQECYENIDYLRKERRVEQNSLENLAQLGSSARLKSNLHDLIQQYMDITDMCSKGKKNSKEVYKCLVIQIDDADLAVNNVFQICEDIRNYFSIPNVLVLMAANFTQLRNAIHQWYLKQYKYIIKMQSREFADECSLMAARYMEKTIPVGHRIVLPDIDTTIREEFQLIKVKYNCEPALFDDNYISCTDIQEQLLKALYQKTGIVLLGKKEKLHSFLPHTLRELTHFVKMLSEMETINHKKVFQTNKDNINSDEIESLRDNLSVIKGYFLEYWCHSHIKKYDYQRLMDKIGLSNQQLPLVYKNIVDYFLLSMNKNPEKITWYDIFSIIDREIEKVTEEEPEGFFEFQEALHLYGTIMLNEWFIKVAKNKEQINNLINITGKILDVSKLYNNGKIKGYQFFKFTFNRDILMEYLGEKKELDETKIWFKKYFDSFISSEDNNKSPVILENGKLVWNKNFQTAEFDFFQALLVDIMQYWQSVDKEDGKLQSGQDSSEDNASDKTGNYEIIASRLVMARNIIANYDVYRRIQEKIISECQDLEQKQNSPVLNNIYKDFYGIVDSAINEDVKYLGEQGSLKEIFENDTGVDNRLQMLFLSNEENHIQYVKEYKECLKEVIDNNIELLVNYRPDSDVQGDEYLVGIETTVPFMNIDFDVPIWPLRQLKDFYNELHNESNNIYNKIKKILEDANNEPDGKGIQSNEDINNRIMECIKQGIQNLKQIEDKINSINVEEADAPKKRKS